METYTLGKQTLAQLLGDETAQTVSERFKALSPVFEEEAVSVVFGRTWSREQLPAKQRALISIGILAAQGRHGALRIVFDIALKNGVTEEEIVEALLQVGIYAGYPAALDALGVLEALRGEASKN